MKKPPPVTTSQHLKSSNASSVADEDDDTPCDWSSKVIDFGTDRKRVYDFLFDFNSNLGPILPRFRDITAFVRRKPLFYAPHPYSGENSSVFPLE